MTYSDSEIKPFQCSPCAGSGVVPVGRKYAGSECSSCNGSGKKFPLRKTVLAEAFQEGRLPEQSVPPNHQWCPRCRPKGKHKLKDGIPLHYSCPSCKGRTIIKV